MVLKQPLIGIAPSRTFPGTWWDMVEVCQKFGFAGVEFKHELPFTLPERWSWDMIRRIASLAKEQDWFLALHGPYTNIGALLPKRWQAAVDEHLEALEIAQALGARTYTVHPGWVEEKYCTQDLLQRCRENTAQALAEMLIHSDKVIICLENQNPSEREKTKVGISPENLRFLVRDLPRVMFTFDLGHAQVFNGSPAEFASALGPKRIGIAHIHDNAGFEDSHLPPGRGNVDWETFLLRYQREGWSFPLFLETIGSGPEFRTGHEFILNVWEKLLVKGRTNA